MIRKFLEFCNYLFVVIIDLKSDGKSLTLIRAKLHLNNIVFIFRNWIVSPALIFCLAVGCCSSFSNFIAITFS